MQRSRELDLRRVPEEAYGRSVRDAIPYLQKRSAVASGALHVVVRKSNLSEDARLLAFRVLEDELSQGDQADLYFRIASEAGRVLEWYGHVRLVNGEFRFEWVASY